MAAPWTEECSIMKKTGIINKIIAFSNVDGPGNRTAVFFQGCNNIGSTFPLSLSVIQEIFIAFCQRFHLFHFRLFIIFPGIGSLHVISRSFVLLYHAGRGNTTERLPEKKPLIEGVCISRPAGSS